MSSISETLAQAAKMTDLKEAFRLIATFVGKPIMEHQVPTNFDEANGQPSEFTWLPYETWDGRLYPHRNLSSLGLENTDPLRAVILEKLQLNEAVTFTVGDKHIFVRFVPSQSEGSGTVSRHLQFEEARQI